MQYLTETHLEFLFSHSDYRLLFHQVLGLLQLNQKVATDLRRIYGNYLSELSDLISPIFGPQQRREMSLALMAFSTGLAAHHLLFHQKLGIKIDRKSIEQRIVRALQ